jgi:hypothetical protein
MLLTKTNPTGINLYVQKLQTELHNKLIAKWAISDTTQYKCYGLCYRNKLDNGYVAEVYDEGGDYKEIFWDDNLTATSFFGLSGSIDHVVNDQTNIHLVFFVDLDKLALKDFKGNTITHRADAEVRQGVESIIGSYSNGFQLKSTELWLENVLREYPGSRRDGGSLKVKADMHPIHCFRLNLKLVFNPNKNC